MNQPPRFIPQVRPIIEHDGRYLLIQPVLIPGEAPVAPAFPVGKLGEEEAISAAAKRIAKETTGLDIIVSDVVSIHIPGGPAQLFNLYASTQNPQEATINNPLWVTKEELQTMVAESASGKPVFGSPSTPQVAKEILAGKRYPLSLFEPFV